jgi:hypothetical protein
MLLRSQVPQNYFNRFSSEVGAMASRQKLE